MQVRSDLDQFFHPDGVAILGRVDRDADPDELRRQMEERYAARFYLVNPKGGSVGDVIIYPSVTDIADYVGLAVVNVGPQYVAGALEQCGDKGIPYVLIFTAGFSEVGPEGAAIEPEIAEVARRRGIRIFGPNTNTNAFERMPEIPNLRGGKIGLLTQSGHQGRPIVQGSLFGIGFSRWVPTGNEVDLEMADFLEYFAYDDETAVIAAYVEGFRDGGKLRRALQAANDQRKPVVMVKVGSTSAGSRMAQSHTGHLTGSDAVVQGLFAQHGVVRVRDLDELLETAALFAKLPARTGDGLCLYSISGGSGTLMAEVAEQHGLTLPALSEETQRRLHELLPDYLTVANPVDNGGQFLTAAPADRRVRVLELIADDPAVDLIVIGITGALGEMTDNFCADIRQFADRSPKPLVATWNSFKVDERGFQDLIDTGIPLFRSFRNCFAALRDFYAYERAAGGFRARPPLAGRLGEDVDALLHSRGGVLGARDAKALLDASGVSSADEVLVTSAGAAAEAAASLGFPVAMKIASPGFPHKSEAGLVRLGIGSATAARAAYRDLVGLARAAKPLGPIEGVVVQEQVPDGVEMIVGVTHDATLGPAVMVGTGGIFAEVLADVAVRPLPVDARDADDMIRSLRGFPLLDGARGRPPADVNALVDVVMAVARLAAACGPKLRELDLNPVLVREKGAVAVDSLVILAD